MRDLLAPAARATAAIALLAAGAQAAPAPDAAAAPAAATRPAAQPTTQPTTRATTQPTVVKTSRVAPDSPVAREVLDALRSGRAMAASYYLFPLAKTPAQRRQMMQRHAAFLGRVRAFLPARPVYAFADGVEFTIVSAEGEAVSAAAVMTGETEERPSTFRLTAEPKRQAYVICNVAGRGPGEASRVHLLMWHVEGRWRATHVGAFSERIGGMDFDKALAEALAEQLAGRDFEALAMFMMADQLSATPKYHLAGREQRLQEAYSVTFRKLDLARNPVQTLTTADGEMAIASLEVTWFPDGAYVVLNRNAARERPAVMAACQERVARACFRRHPRLARRFTGIAVARYFRGPDGRQQTFSTRYDFAKLAAAAAAATTRPTTQPAATTAPAAPRP
jgi:hypothetical protein